MTFDQWIDAVNLGLHARLGPAVRTAELSWDSAMWVSANGTVVAELADDEATAKLHFDAGDTVSLAFQDADGRPDVVSDTIVRRLTADAAARSAR